MRGVSAWKAIAGLSLLVGSGCSADSAPNGARDVSLPPGIDRGGQTGSLLPRCGVAPLFETGSAVPAGDAAFVVYTSGCAAGQSFGLRDAHGNDVELELEALGNGAFLARVPTGLNAGDYEVVAPTGADARLDSLRVNAASALPMRLGTLEVTSQDCTALQFRLTLDAAALSYAPLTQLSASVDGAPENLWVNYGALPLLDDGTSPLSLFPCAWGTACLSMGAHRLVVNARIAGEVATPDPLSVDFDVECAAPSAPLATSTASPSSARCSLSAASQAASPLHSSPSPLLGFFLSCVAFLVARRRAKEPVT